MLKASDSGSSSGKSAKDGLKHMGNTKNLLKATSKSRFPKVVHLCNGHDKGSKRRAVTSKSHRLFLLNPSSAGISEQKEPFFGGRDSRRGP